MNHVNCETVCIKFKGLLYVYNRRVLKLTWMNWAKEQWIEYKIIYWYFSAVLSMFNMYVWTLNFNWMDMVGYVILSIDLNYMQYALCSFIFYFSVYLLLVLILMFGFFTLVHLKLGMLVMFIEFIENCFGFRRGYIPIETRCDGFVRWNNKQFCMFIFFFLINCGWLSELNYL